MGTSITLVLSALTASSSAPVDPCLSAGGALTGSRGHMLIGCIAPASRRDTSLAHPSLVILAACGRTLSSLSILWTAPRLAIHIAPASRSTGQWPTTRSLATLVLVSYHPRRKDDHDHERTHRRSHLSPLRADRFVDDTPGGTDPRVFRASTTPRGRSRVPGAPAPSRRQPRHPPCCQRTPSSHGLGYDGRSGRRPSP